MQPDLARALVKVKDSYNCDALSLAGAAAALEDQEHFKKNTARIVRTRAVLTAALRTLGFEVLPSHANFVWARRSDRAVQSLFEALKAQDFGALHELWSSWRWPAYYRRHGRRDRAVAGRVARAGLMSGHRVGLRSPLARG